MRLVLIHLHALSVLASIRRLLFWAHLVAGLLAGSVILLMSVTGVLLGFERQMIAAVDGTPRIATPEAPRLPIDSALTRAGIAAGDVASLLVRRDPAMPVTVRFHERGRAALLLDPTLGTASATPEPGRGQRLFSALRRWHRWVGAGTGEVRASMKRITGAANLAFLGLVLSGLWLWWPRHWSWTRWRATAVPSIGRPGRARDFNWHHSLGFWSAIPLAFVVATAVFISYQWPGRWLDRLLGSPAERAAATAPRAEERAAAVVPRTEAPGAAIAARTDARADATDTPRDAAAAAPVPTAPIAALLAAASAAHPAWQQFTLTLPAAPREPARVVVAEGNTYRPDLRTTLVLDRETAAVREAIGYSDLSASRRIRAWVRFGHTGEVFGIPGQLLAIFVSAVGAVLVWTGFALSWRRFRSWLRRGAPARARHGSAAGTSGERTRGAGSGGPGIEGAVTAGADTAGADTAGAVPMAS